MVLIELALGYGCIKLLKKIKSSVNNDNFTYTTFNGIPYRKVKYKREKWQTY